MKKMRLIALVVLWAVLSPGELFAFKPLLSRAEAVLVMELGGEIVESEPWSPLMSLFGEPKPALLDKLMMLRAAGRERTVKAVVVRIQDAGYGMAKAQELRRAMLEFREQSGKPIYAYLELEGGGNLEYYLASAADKVYISPASTLTLNGLSVFRFYLGGLWDKVYLEVQVNQIQEYKSMADMLSRRDMSAAEREAQEAILDSLYEQFIGDIARSRGVDPAAVEGWIDAAWFIPSRYVEAGALDGIRYLDEVVAGAAGADETAVLSEKEFLAQVSSRREPPGRKRVAVVFGVGPIVTGQEDAGGFFLRQVIASDSMVARLVKALEDDRIDAVIFRVDSGGGSALASDLIWRATQRVKAQKPIVVSMSDVAGSGGYYISCGADAIVAQPGTVTGSIGILTAHISAGKLLEKIGVGTEVLGRGEFSTMGSINRLLTEREREKVQSTIASLYDLFLARVAAGRGLPKEWVHELGRGRIWTGAQAHELGLVDRLGGYEAAIEEVKTRLGVPADQEVTLIYKRERLTLWKLFTGRYEAAGFQRFLSAPERALVQALRDQLLWKPGQPLALMPGPVVVK